MTEFRNIQDFIKGLPLFSKKLVLKRNEYLCKPGMNNQYLYFVNKGAVIIFIEQNNAEQIIRFAYDDNIFVCLDSFYGNQPTSFYVQAIKETMIWYCSKKELESYITAHPQYQSYWMKIMESLILQQMEREIDLLIESPQQRFQRVWQRSPQLFQQIPNKYIANYLRMSPETLSRIKKY